MHKVLKIIGKLRQQACGSLWLCTTAEQHVRHVSLAGWLTSTHWHTPSVYLKALHSSFALTGAALLLLATCLEGGLAATTVTEQRSASKSM